MADELIYITNDDTQNYLFCKLQLLDNMFETQFYELTIPYSMKVPKVIKLKNKKAFLKRLWDKCNNQPNVPFLFGD